MNESHWHFNTLVKDAAARQQLFEHETACVITADLKKYEFFKTTYALFSFS